MITRQALDTILVARVGSLLTTVDKDGTTADGNNADLVDPIRSAMRILGYSVANLAAVTDTDLANVSTDDEEALIDLAELQTLSKAVAPAAASMVDITVGPRRESLGQFSKMLDGMIKRKTQAIDELHGSIFGESLEAGVFSVASIEDGENVH